MAQQHEHYEHQLDESRGSRNYFDNMDAFNKAVAEWINGPPPDSSSFARIEGPKPSGSPPEAISLNELHRAVEQRRSREPALAL